ncbi:MAG: hypothetical protein HY699_09170 [Deltaproteobacteria bacterium]|nr:hypothetical protein [Deltaproteobacteria bacterium]
MRYFNYEKIAKQANIPATKLLRLSRRAREEFPDDEMLRELHLLRVCLAVRDGQLTIEDALNPEAAAA